MKYIFSAVTNLSLNASVRHEKPHASDVGAEYASFDDLLAKSDVIIITAALNDSNKEIFDK